MKTMALPYAVFMTRPTEATVERLAGPRCSIGFVLLRPGGWQRGAVSWIDRAPAADQVERILEEAWSVLSSRLARQGRN
jgi:hypothetical protein